MAPDGPGQQVMAATREDSIGREGSRKNNLLSRKETIPKKGA